MPDCPSDAVEQIKEELAHAVRHHGAQADTLWKHSKPLVLLLTPAAYEHVEKASPPRAITAEQRIRTALEAVRRYDSSGAEALSELLALKSDPTVRNNVSTRREKASRCLDIAAETFRKKYETELLRRLAFEIWRDINQATCP